MIESVFCLGLKIIADNVRKIDRFLPIFCNKSFLDFFEGWILFSRPVYAMQSKKAIKVNNKVNTLKVDIEVLKHFSHFFALM